MQIQSSPDLVAPFSGVTRYESYIGSTLNYYYTGLGLGLRFRVRYIKNPVYPNTKDCTKHTVNCFCGTEILGPVCANSGIAESPV